MMTSSQHPGGDATAISAGGITHMYGDRKALDQFSLDVPRGSVFGLLGPNGSGKSTFISLIASTEAPAAGSVSVLGQAPHRSLRVRIGIVFQENALDPLMRVDETLALAGRLYGMTSQQITTRGRQLLDQFGLADRGRDAISTLSGGMRRRVEMARALLHDPELLLLDEPTTGVDPGERRALWDGLLGRQDGHRTILVATNDLAEADAHCDRAAFIRGGRVMATGTLAELKAGLRAQALRVTWEHPEDGLLDAIRGWPETGSATADDGQLLVVTDDAPGVARKLFDLAPNAIRGITISSATLEDAYFQHVARVTGQHEVPA